MTVLAVEGAKTMTPMDEADNADLGKEEQKH